VGCIILSPTTDLAGQIFEVFRNVGKLHSFSAGAIVGKRKGIEEEKTRMNYLNIIVCTPGRLVQHFNETPNFDCSNLQVSRHLLCYNYSEFPFRQSKTFLLIFLLETDVGARRGRSNS
jgi:hypothetical protein